MSKNRQDRRDRRRDGMKLIQMWVPDPRRPEFVSEARRQGLLLRGELAEMEALGFTDAAFDWPKAQ